MFVEFGILDSKPNAQRRFSQGQLKPKRIELNEERLMGDLPDTSRPLLFPGRESQLLPNCSKRIWLVRFTIEPLQDVWRKELAGSGIAA